MADQLNIWVAVASPVKQPVNNWTAWLLTRRISLLLFKTLASINEDLTPDRWIDYKTTGDSLLHTTHHTILYLDDSSSISNGYPNDSVHSTTYHTRILVWNESIICASLEVIFQLMDSILICIELFKFVALHLTRTNAINRDRILCISIFKPSSAVK